LAAASPPSSASIRAWTFSAVGQPGGPFHVSAKRAAGWATTASDHPNANRPAKVQPALLTSRFVRAIGKASNPAHDERNREPDKGKAKAPSYFATCLVRLTQGRRGSRSESRCVFGRPSAYLS